MGLLSIISKGIKAMIDEANTPESFKTGEKFEEYVRKFLFTDKHYNILERTHSFQTNKDYVQSSMKPDFKFFDKLNKKEFYVEAKFRTGLYKDKIQWCNPQQLERYVEYSKTCPVFVIIGMGEKPDYPEYLTLIPLSQAKYTGLFPSHADKFSIPIDSPVHPKSLWQR